MPTALVVISHYNAWPVDQLVALLDQIRRVPSGHPFRCLVVVNQAVNQPLRLPPEHADVEILYRENTGYNIGAWEHGWRAAPPADYYLFLQEECRIARPGWLAAFIRLASRPEVGLVGESLVWRKLDWKKTEYLLEGLSHDGSGPDDVGLSFYDGLTRFLDAKGIPHGESGEHLQSLILCARRQTLEAIGGFRIGKDKGEAVCCEIAISRSVAAQGLQVRQAGLLKFRHIVHPQWLTFDRGMYHLGVNLVYRHAPTSFLMTSRNLVHGLRKLAIGLTRFKDGPAQWMPHRPR